jgi:hypothetical protein
VLPKDSEGEEEEDVRSMGGGEAEAMITEGSKGFANSRHFYSYAHSHRHNQDDKDDHEAAVAMAGDEEVSVDKWKEGEVRSEAEWVAEIWPRHVRQASKRPCLCALCGTAHLACGFVVSLHWWG